MTVSVRMDPMLEQELEAAAKRQGMTKSQFIIDAVQRALGQKDAYRVLMDVQQEYGLVRPGRRSLALMDGPGVTTARPTAGAGTPGGPAWRADLHARQSAAMADWLAYQAAKKAGKEWVAPTEAAPAERPKAAPRKATGARRVVKR